MDRSKISSGQIDLVRILSEGVPDIVFHVPDPEMGDGYVAGYMWGTCKARWRLPSPIAEAIADLDRKEMLKVVSLRPNLLNRLVGAKTKEYLYLTPLGQEAATNISMLFEPMERDDYDRRYEPKGMWLRQILGLPPKTD